MLGINSKSIAIGDIEAVGKRTKARKRSRSWQHSPIACVRVRVGVGSYITTGSLQYKFRVLGVSPCRLVIGHWLAGWLAAPPRLSVHDPVTP